METILYDYVMFPTSIIQRRLYMITESTIFSGYYEIPFANESLISRSGAVIDKRTGRALKTRLEPVQNVYTVNLKHDGHTAKASLHRVLASVFIPKPAHLSALTGREIFVIPRDNNFLNLDLDNLIWVSNQDYQKHINTQKREEALKQFGWVESDELTECTAKSGFYWIPGIRYPVVISRAGMVFNLMKGRPVPTQVSKRGYHTLSLWNESLQRYDSHRLHRIVTKTFHPVPAQYQDLSLADLQVNHLDGDKGNNCAENLEWCVNEENMAHARSTGLFSNEKTVLVRDVRTNTVTTFVSISACARAFDIDSASLSTHLRSTRSAGRITIKWCVFKFDDGKPWPQLLMEDIEQDSYVWRCNVFVKEIASGKAYIFADYKHACRQLNLNLYTLKWHLYKEGANGIFKGYRFELMDDSFEFKE